MKKRLLTRIVSATAAVAICATAFVGCGKDDGKCVDGGEHAYTWTVVTEATCSAEGFKRGVCGICGDIREESIPVDPEAHSYGEWAITAPTESEEGLAVKTCAHNAEHTYSVVLPAYSLTSTVGYDEHIIKVNPTAASEGQLYLEKEDALGTIAFTVTVPKRTVSNMADAITLAVTLGGTVRTSEGYYTERTDGIQNRFSVYFGDDYVKVQETGDNTETWYSYDDEGKIFGIYRAIPTESNPDPVARRDEAATDQNMQGFSYQSGGGDTRVYGAEGLMKNAYEGYCGPDAVLKSEPVYIKNNDGTAYVEFGFSRYENPRFVRYKLSATLDKSGAIVSATQETSIIHAYMIATDNDGQPVFKDDGDIEWAPVYLDDSSTGGFLPMYDLDGNEMFLKDENGEDVLNTFGQKVPLYQYIPEVEGRLNKVSSLRYEIGDDGSVEVWAEERDGNGNLVNSAEAVYKRDENGDIVYYPSTNIPVTVPTYYYDNHSEVNQRKIVYENQTFKSADDDPGENQFPSSVLYIQNFDISYSGNIIGDEVVSVPSNKPVSFAISNIQPTTATLSYDPLTLYIRTEARDIELTIEPSDNEYSMTGFFNKTTNQPTINAQYAGEVTLVLKTKGGLCEKVVKLKFEKSAPTGSGGDYPLKSQVNAYQEIDGEVVYSWKDYTSKEPYSVYTNQPFTARASVSEAGAAFIDTSFYVYEISDETYNKVGDDTVAYTTNADGTVTFTAKKAGRYTIILRSSVSASATTSFDVVVEEQPAISAMLINGTVYSGHFKYIKAGEGNPAPADVTVTVVNNNNWRQGTLTIVVAGNETVYDYTYSEADGKFTATYKSGVNKATFDFSFAINEAFSLTVTHSTGFADLIETIVLSSAEEAE